VPVSVNAPPFTGVKLHSYPRGWSVSRSTPNVSALRTSLLGATLPIEVWLLPPVPTMNSRMPCASGAPAAVWGAKRS
jgi:hypothetical protein